MKCHTISSSRVLNTYLVAAAALAMAARTVSAAKTPEFPCTDGWTNASSTNEFDCSGSSVTTFISDSAVWSTFVPAAIGILCLIPISCIIVFGRYCCNCCGSSKVRPNSFCGGQCCGEDPDDNLSDEQKAPLYSDRCIYAVRFLCVFAAVAAIAGFVLNYVGGSRVAGGVRDVDPTLDNVAGWAMGILDELKAGVVDPNNSSKYPTGFDEEMFTSAAANIRSYQKDAKDVVADYSDKAILVSEIIGYVTAAPAVVLLLPIVSAFFCVRRFLPLIFILLSFFFQFVYFVFSSVCLILVLAFTMLHEDVTTTSSDQRSVTQWYLIPRCEVEAPFDDAKTNVAEMEKNACIEACTELLNFCDNTNVWLMDEKIFYCDLTDANTCTDLTILNTIVDGMHTKATVPAAAGCGDEAAAQGQTCDIDLCATNCTQAAARNAASSAVENLATANRVKNAYTTILLPYMSCSVLLTKTVSIGIESVILQLRDGSTLLATGSLLISCGLIIAIIGGFLGQKRFLNKAQLMAFVADGGTSPHPIAADKMGTSTGDFSLSSPYGNEKAARGAANRNAKPSYESQMYDEAMTERAAPQRK